MKPIQQSASPAHAFLAGFKTLYGWLSSEPGSTLAQKYASDFRAADRQMLAILIVHWAAAALVTGMSHGTHLLGLVGGGLIVGLATIAYVMFKGRLQSRLMMGIALMLFSVLFIEQNAGRIEYHFHIFAALALLLRYRDPTPLLAAAGFIAVHHLTFNYCQAAGFSIGGHPIVIFDYGTGLGIVVLHAAFVIAEVCMLSFLSVQITRTFRHGALLEEAIERVAASGDFSIRTEAADAGPLLAFNTLMQALDEAVTDTMQTVEDIASGNFAGELTETAIGDLGRLATGVAAAGLALEFSMSELARVMRGLESGDFSVRMDPLLPEKTRMDVDRAMATLDSTFDDLGQISVALARGDFSRRTQVAGKGQVQQMQAGLDQALGTMEAAFAAINLACMELAGGNLTARVGGNHPGGLKTLQESFDSAAARLQELVVAVAKAGNQVADQSVQVARSSDTLNDRTARQAASLEETAASMEELTNSLGETASQTSQAVTAVDRSDALVAAGIETGKRTADAMDRIQSASSEVGAITSLIDNIAFQTKLLALNAAVEAARAGEHGRGFAVVATEVQTLAQRTSDAAGNIRELVRSTQDIVRDGSALVAESADALDKLGDSATDVRQRVSQIATAINEQVAGVRMVNQAVAELDQITQTNQQVVEASAKAGQTLGVQSATLGRLIGRFATEAGHPTATEITDADVAEPTAAPA